MHTSGMVHDTRRRALAAAALAMLLTALMAAGGASIADARSYKFKLDISIKQSVSWQSGWKSHEICGTYRHVYKGDGSGGFTVTGKRIPVTFKSMRGGLSTTDFAIPNHNVRRNSSYTISGEGDPGHGCMADLSPTPIDTSKCGAYKYKSRDKRFALLVIGGRLAPFGSIDDRMDAKCPDETSWSVVTKGGASKQRKDVDKLIKNPRVRSIELSAGRAASGDPDDPDLTAKDFFLLGDQDTVTGFGFASYKWSVKLTRVR